MNLPNVIIAICDGLRPKDLSLYGYEVETDKYLKQIASECVVFQNNFTSSNASDSSVTSLFSGQRPETNGFIHQHPFMKKEEIDKLRKNRFWLPLYLKKKGYFTISATPLHLWFKKGFDSQKTIESNKDRNKLLNNSFIKKILLSLPNWAYTFGKKIVKSRASPQFYSSKEVVNLAISNIKEAKKSFFLFMHIVDTHCPYAAADSKFIRGDETLSKIIKNIKYSSQREYIKKRFQDVGVQSLQEIIYKRNQSIKLVSKDLFRLYSFLKKNQIWDDTIFVLLSDHGDSFGEHSNYLCRGGLFDNIIQTPLIIHLPGIKSSKINELTQNIDIIPTILDFIGDNNIKFDGKSLIPLIKENKKLRDEIRIVDSYCEERYALRSKIKKKIITVKGGKCYLCGGYHHLHAHEEYNLESDPDEKINLFGT